MELRLYKGAKLLEISGLYRDGNLFIPGAALDTHVGTWKGEVLFVDSPLAGKRICLTVLGPGNRLTLPATVEKFISCVPPPEPRSSTMTAAPLLPGT